MLSKISDLSGEKDKLPVVTKASSSIFLTKQNSLNTNMPKINNCSSGLKSAVQNQFGFHGYSFDEVIVFYCCMQCDLSEVKKSIYLHLLV